MPELPEVETVCRIMRRVLVGHKIVDVEVADDHLFLSGLPPGMVAAALACRTVRQVGRKGKFWWLDTGEPPVVFAHLGMTGWIRELGAFTTRLKEHGKAPLDDDQGRPRFLKLLLTTDQGKRISFTDGRRLGRIWLSESAETDKRVQQLGPDALEELPRGTAFARLFAKRTAPIKALLLDQRILSGIGNWIADEALYHARIAPARAASSLSTSELSALRSSIFKVVKLAVDAGADETKYPKGWMFHHRWGGGRGVEKIGGKQIVRDTVGGRTTAWVPSLQR